MFGTRRIRGGIRIAVVGDRNSSLVPCDARRLSLRRSAVEPYCRSDRQRANGDSAVVPSWKEASRRPRGGSRRRGSVRRRTETRIESSRGVRSSRARSRPDAVRLEVILRVRLARSNRELPASVAPGSIGSRRAAERRRHFVFAREVVERFRGRRDAFLARSPDVDQGKQLPIELLQPLEDIVLASIEVLNALFVADGIQAEASEEAGRSRSSSSLTSSRSPNRLAPLSS